MACGEETVMRIVEHVEDVSMIQAGLTCSEGNIMKITAKQVHQENPLEGCSIPVVLKPSPATCISSRVSNPTAAFEQVARKERTMNSYRRAFSVFQLCSPAVCFVGCMGG